jgi:hypothetical protein
VKSNGSITDTVYVSQTITKYDTVYVDRVKIVPQLVYVNTPNSLGNSLEQIPQNTSNDNIALLENKGAKSGVISKKSENVQTQTGEVGNENEQTNVAAENKAMIENTKTLDNEKSAEVALNELSKKEYKNTAKAPKFRKVNYQIPFESIRDFYRRDIRLTVVERLSVEAFFGGSQNQLILKNTSQQG